MSDFAAQKRFWRKVRIDGECWIWTGLPTANGYGSFFADGRAMRSHRFAYNLLVGEIPQGKVLDHLCRNRLCVNPDHLEPVTNRENILRGEGATAKNARRTHCIHGHPLSGPNLWLRDYGDGHALHRVCRTCFDSRRRAPRDKTEVAS